MVATAVLSMLVVMLVGMLNRTGAAWTAGQAQIDRRQSARALADSITQELRTALLPLNPADSGSLQLVVNPPALADTLRNPDSIFWQAPIATNRSRGDVAEVGYFLEWDATGPNGPRPHLCRFFVNPTDTANYLIYQTPAAWLSDSIIKTVAPATRPTAYRGLFAENVIGLWVRCYEQDKSGNLVPLPNPFDSRTKKNLPRAIKIFLVLIDPQALVKVREIPDYSMAGSTGEPDLERFISALPGALRQSARSFTTEVRLQNSL
ncbi:MAG: hypothetical protein QOE70_2640 [Chthoniobacter sp.]|nr:hypothetical protein [Chthoniobacter sp.]